MKDLEFPIIGTKGSSRGRPKEFDLSSPAGRKKYFEAKAGDEIKHIKSYLNKKTFIAYFLGKKNSGKGTYSKLFQEIFSSTGRSASGRGKDKIEHVSVGDVVRDYHTKWDKFSKSGQLNEFKRLYRGFMSFDDAVDALLGRSTSKLLPTEFILALLKYHISTLAGKTIFIDGLPRELDQISYSLYFRDLIAYRDDPDIFILIDIPESVIDARIKSRVICPLCKTPRNSVLDLTSKVEFEAKSKRFFLTCDNPDCKGARMVGKEGDELGIGPIKDRLKKDEEILRRTFSLHGVPKVLLRNHIPISEAKKYFDDYEITSEYVLGLDEKKNVVINEKAWTIKDDNGVECISLLPAPVVISLLKQLVEALDL